MPADEVCWSTETNTLRHNTAKMSLKIFGDLMSQPARAVAIFCRAAEIPHQLVKVRITAGETKTPDYTKMNPFQKVPVLLDGDFALTESVAMMR